MRSNARRRRKRIDCRQRSQRDEGLPAGWSAGARSIVASAQSVPATRLTPSATEDFTPRDLLGRQKVSSTFHRLASFVGGGRRTRTRGLAKGRARRSFTNLASCQEQEDLAHPFLSLSLGEKEIERESYSRCQTARSKTGCQRILAILSVREETPSPHIFTTFSHSSCSFF